MASVCRGRRRTSIRGGGRVDRQTNRVLGNTPGEQPGFLLVRSDPEGILCLVDTEHLSASALVRPVADTISLSVRGSVVTSFSSARCLLIRALGIRSTAVQ